MRFIYNISVLFYSSVIHLASAFYKKARLWVNGRKNWDASLKSKIKTGEDWIWFHCSSVGEYEDSCEIFKKIKGSFPKTKTLLTFFSPSGYELLKNTQEYDLVTYLPIDTKKNVQKFLDILNPKAVFFSKSELWLNITTEIKQRNIPLFLISLRFFSYSNYFKWPIKYLFKKVFFNFHHIYCQDDFTKNMLQKSFNYTNTSITGNTRFDRTLFQSKNKKYFPEIEKFINGSFIVIAGSTLSKDVKNLLYAYDKLSKLTIKWIVVPHEINETEINRVIGKLSGRGIKYTEINKQSEEHNLLIVNTVGILKHLYQYANLAVIGGGFDKIGIHSVIEPAVYGVFSTFGPNHRNYREALDLLSINGAKIHTNQQELTEIIKNHYDAKNPTITKPGIIDYIHSQTGSAEATALSIEEELKGLL